LAKNSAKFKLSRKLHKLICIMHTLCHPIPRNPTPSPPFSSSAFPAFPLSFVCVSVPLICICSDGGAENYDSKMWPAGCVVGKMGKFAKGGRGRWGYCRVERGMAWPWATFSTRHVTWPPRPPTRPPPF